ncbi:MAG: chromate transporter [Victivallaceae bacterium]|nr:chromate transporter [Victivallaceae bacterium]
MKQFQRLWPLCWEFGKISAVTVGGGVAMIPLIEEAFVDKRKFLSEEEMLDVVAVTQSVPGIIAVNMAVLTGYRAAGIAGAFAAAAGAAVPPFAAIVLVAAFFAGLGGNRAVDGMFLGVRSAVTALIFLAAIKLYRQTIKTKFSFLVAVTAFVLLGIFRVDAVSVILGAGVVGVVWMLLCRRKQKESGGGQ